jgi:hypothetical protein
MSAVQMKLAAIVLAALLAVASAAAALYGSFHHGVTVTDLRWKALWADQQVLQAKGLAAAATANRTEEQRRQTAINQVGKDARQQQAAASADGVAADAAGERVRAQISDIATRSSCTSGDPGSTERSKTAARAAMVLSELFQRADKRAGELAKAFDAARIAGLSCEQSFAKVKSGDPPAR